jgi:hypothetical protein
VEDCILEHTFPKQIIKDNRGYDTLNIIGKIVGEAMIFSEIARDLNNRKLSYESDLLNAFAGISRYLGKRFGWTFWNGLPTENFDNYILFSAIGSKRRQGFPSWSWAGWKQDGSGSVPLISQHHGSGQIIREITWHIYLRKPGG